jgi:hypothetical protein
MILEYPMVDRDPVERWTPAASRCSAMRRIRCIRAAQTAPQSILDCRALADCLKGGQDPLAALVEYERLRRPATANVVLTNRQNPPDAILREVFLRTGDRPFQRIEDVITREELAGMSERYHRVSGSDRETVRSAR